MEASFSPPNLKRIGYPKNTIYMKIKLEYRCFHSIDNGKPKNEECKGCSGEDLNCPNYHTNKAMHLYNPKETNCRVGNRYEVK